MEGHHEHYSGYRWEVLQKLFRRNENERKRYEDVVHLTNSLYELIDFHQKENRRLIVTNAKLENELQDGTDRSSSISGERNSAGRRYSVLQEELADLLKQKSELAQQVISLRSSVDEKERQLALQNAKIQELEAQLAATEELLKETQRKFAETELNQQLVKDEYEALHITYSSMEEKKQKLEKENQDLIARLIELKAVHADKMNEETELFQRKRQAKLRKELEDAAKEPTVIDIGRLKHMVCLDAIVPKKVHYKFSIQDGVLFYSGWLFSYRKFFDAHDGEINAVAWTHSDFRFATAGGDRKVKLWDFTSGQAFLKGVTHESNSSVYSIDFDSEETLLLAASCDFASRVWSISDMKIKHTLTGHGNKVMSAKFLGEKGLVVSGSHDRTLKIWDLRRRACIRTILAGSSVNDVVTSDRNGSNLVSGHFDKKIRFWDMRSESSTHEILLQGRITSLDLSADGYLLCCVRDDSLKLIDFRMNNVVRTFSSDGFLIGCDWTRAKFSPDGQFCVCGSNDGSIYIWVISDGSIKKILREHSFGFYPYVMLNLKHTKLNTIRSLSRPTPLQLYQSCDRLWVTISCSNDLCNATVIACAWSWCGNYLLSCDKNKKAVLWSEF